MTNMSTPTTVYSVEATFHLQHVNQYNVRISGTNNPHAVFEGTRENTSFNVFLLYLKIHSLSFFFAKRTVTGVVYVDILQEFLMLRRGSHWHSSPVRWSTWHLLFYFAVEDFLDQMLPWKLIGRGRPTSQPPSFSSTYTIWLLLLGVHKSCILCSNTSTPLLELAARIQTNEATVTPTMLKNVWHELENIYDIYLGTHSAPTEHLLAVQCRSQKLDKRT